MCCGLFLTESYAQPTFYFSPDQVVATGGSQICKQIKLVDFTDILGVDFSVNWDPAVLEFASIQALHPDITDLDLSDFDVSQAASGIITISWETGDCASSPVGISLFPDDQVFFEICYNVIGGYGSHTDVEITDMPLETKVTRVNSNCMDIGHFANNCNVTVDVEPLKVNISSASGNEGDVVCIDFTVEDFEQIVNFQFSIHYDSSVLNLATNGITTSNLPGFSPTLNANLVQEGIINIIWFTEDGFTVDDGTQILQLCFEIVGVCGDETPVEILDEPIPIEVTNIPGAGIDMGLVSQSGQVTVNCFDPDGIGINIPDQTACQGESFCVDVTVDNFTDINEMFFTLGWNEEVIELTSVSGFTSNLFLFANSVDDGMSSQGVLKIEWDNGFSLGTDLNDGHVLFTMCFDVVGPGGSNSTISVIGNPVSIFIHQFGTPPGENLGVNSNNGLVTIKPSVGITVDASDVEGNPGDIVCVDFTVQDFDEILRMAYTVNWETDILQFSHVQGFNLQDMEALNFLTGVVANGALGVEWEPISPPNPVSVPDGTVIFQVCFEVVGDPFECTEISFGDLPFEIDIVNDVSNGLNIGLNGQPGEACVLNPFEFEINISDEAGTQGSEACVDFAVTNFNSLTVLDFSVNWDISVIEFSHVDMLLGNLPNFNQNSFDDDILFTEDGELPITWQSTNQITGESVPDGTVIFQVCYTIIGVAGECSPVTISGTPQPIVINSASTGGSNLGVGVNDGSVCVNDVISLVSLTSTEVDCPGTFTGSIDIELEGGSEDYAYNWSGEGIIDPSVEDPQNVTNGIYCVTISDVNNANLSLMVCDTVELGMNAIFADAGVDTTFECGNISIVLNGCNSSVGNDITYEWNVIGNGLIFDEDTCQPMQIGGEGAELIVTDQASGCVNVDTVWVSPAVTPGVVIEEETAMIFCEPDSVLLDGSASTSGPDFIISWEGSNGGVVDPDTDEDLVATAQSPGMYVLTIFNTQSGCSATDTIMVMADTLAPIADAGLDTLLKCGDDFVMLDGSSSSAGSDFLYQWTSDTGGGICAMDNTMNSEACEPGTYELLVTDTTNGCFANDFVMIESDTLKPDIESGPDRIIDCDSVTVTLLGTVTSQGTYTYEWTTTGSGNITNPNTLEPTVDDGGDYSLLVTDASNNCFSVVEVAVSVDNEMPTAVIAPTDEITCETTEIPLDGSTSSTGPDYTYAWSTSMGSLPDETNSIVVNAEENYTLLVTDTTNGCTAEASMMVVENNTPPTLTAAAPDDLTCVDMTVPLESNFDTNNPDINVQWVAAMQTCFSGPSNIPNPTVSCPGEYIVNIIDNTTGCVNSDTVMVAENMDNPEITFDIANMLTCIEDCTDLTVTVMEPATGFTISWKDQIGMDVGSASTINVCNAETYSLLVTNDVNGCTVSEIVDVQEDVQEPTVDAGADGLTDCDTDTDVLDGSNSDPDVTYSWAATTGMISGATDQATMTGTAGAYVLTITSNVNGCTAMDNAMIQADTIAPVADAGAGMTLECDDPLVSLDGSGSDTGFGFSLEWSDQTGPLGTFVSQDVEDPGTYTLTVTNLNNGCTAEDSVLVQEADSGPPASATADNDECSDEAVLMANLPENATGVWTVLNSGAIVNPDTTDTEVMGLGSGENSFVWTLSLGDCIDYSTDTVTLMVYAEPPRAENDLEVVNEQTIFVESNVFDNDVLFGMPVTFDTISSPIAGKVDSIGNGIIYFTPPDLNQFFGSEIDIYYEICSENCPELCDTAFVRFEIERPAPPEPGDTPNGITPNGDGLNDALIFDILLFNPNEFPNNEIVIFNRWGDIVYEASPYNNDWAGTNQSGNELPHGTYYYILRMDLNDGDIIRGDVTIVK